MTAPHHESLLCFKLLVVRKACEIFAGCFVKGYVAGFVAVLDGDRRLVNESVDGVLDVCGRSYSLGTLVYVGYVLLHDALFTEQHVVHVDGAAIGNEYVCGFVSGVEYLERVERVEVKALL